MITKLYVYTTNFIADLRKDERGVTAIEYGLIAIAMAVLLATVFFTNAGFVDDLETAFKELGQTIDKQESKF
ncbi:Flp family type IVb pilin [Vibrio splendidus]|uniref:Flp family type IVb pilin n=1 Tax=Vibrio splendidus TaxID=29497 RepID=UPI0021B48341|nr:Flp family type IVb pilin [Vibrio splendidus]UWZ99133.1 Flp family type IVb pilin [Vibrio splendidus]